MTQQEMSALSPVPVAFLVCDQVSEDRTTGKKTVVGVFGAVWVMEFPGVHGPAALYIRLIDCEGHYDCKIEFVRVSTQEIMLEIEGSMEALDRHAYVEMTVPLPRLPLPTAGEYEFRLWMNNMFVSNIRFEANKVPQQA